MFIRIFIIYFETDYLGGVRLCCTLLMISDCGAQLDKLNIFLKRFFCKCALWAISEDKKLENVDRSVHPIGRILKFPVLFL